MWDSAVWAGIGCGYAGVGVALYAYWISSNYVETSMPFDVSRGSMGKACIAVTVC